MTHIRPIQATQTEIKHVPYICAIPAYMHATSLKKRWGGVCTGLCVTRCVAVMGDDGGKVVRPQGGWGVDHPKQVQQNKAQTDILFFSTPPATTTLKSNLLSEFARLYYAICLVIEALFAQTNSLFFNLNFANRRQKAQITADFGVSDCDITILQAPGVLVTLKKVCCLVFAKFKTLLYGINEGSERKQLHFEPQEVWLSREHLFD